MYQRKFAVLCVLLSVSIRLIASTTGLHTAVRQANLPFCKERIALGDGINEREIFEGKTALHLAVERGLREIVIYLLAAGADPNIASNDVVNPYPLHLAVVGQQGDLIEILLNAGSDINNRSLLDGKTVLHKAAEIGLYLIVEKLISLGAACDMYDFNGNTPLDLAQNNKKTPIALLLKSRTVATTDESC